MAIILEKVEQEQEKSTSGFERFIRKNSFLLIFISCALLLLSIALAFSYQRETTTRARWNELKKQWHVDSMEGKDLEALNEALLPIAVKNPHLAGELKPSLVTWALARGKDSDALKLLRSGPSKTFFPNSSSREKQMLDDFNQISKQHLHIESLLSKNEQPKDLQAQALAKGENFLTTYSFPRQESENEQERNLQAVAQYLYLHQLLRQIVASSAWELPQQKDTAKKSLLTLVQLETLPSNPSLLEQRFQEFDEISSLIDEQLNVRASLLSKEERQKARADFFLYLYDKLAS